MGRWRRSVRRSVRRSGWLKERLGGKAGLVQQTDTPFDYLVVDERRTATCSHEEEEDPGEQRSIKEEQTTTVLLDLSCTRGYTLVLLYIYVREKMDSKIKRSSLSTPIFSRSWPEGEAIPSAIIKKKT